MSFSQVYYTSCERGLRSGKGFQLQAASAELGPRLLEAVERRGLYVPPPSLPTRPDAAELASFPVALQFEDLGDGLRMLGQARYLGQDYSGRFGNYFSHAFIAPVEAYLASGGLPVESFGASAWSTTESPAPELPPAPALPVGGWIQPEAVQRFLQQPDKRAALPGFFAAVGQALSGRKRMIVVAEPLEVAYWVATAAYMLPPRLLGEWTFNTYVKNPYQSDVLLAGIYRREDSDFSFSSHELTHQYSVLDFRGGEGSPLQAPSGPWAQAAQWCQDGRLPERAAFGRFWARVAPGEGWEDWPSASAAYAYLQSDGQVGLPSAAVRYLAPHAARLTPEEARTAQRAWHQGLTQEQDPRRTLQWLELGRSLGALAQLDARGLFALGYERLALTLDDEAVRDGLEKLAPSPQGQELLAGVADRLVENPRLALGAVIGAWLNRGALRGPFEAAALRKQAWALLCQVASFGEGERLPRLEHLLALAGPCRVAPATALDEGCLHIWKGKRPTPSEALGVLELASGALSPAQIEFCASALAAGSVTRLEAGRERLLQRLLAEVERAAAPAWPAEARLIQWAREASQVSSLDAGACFAQGLALLDQAPSRADAWPGEWQKEVAQLLVRLALTLPTSAKVHSLSTLRLRHPNSARQALEQEMCHWLREETPDAVLGVLALVGRLAETGTSLDVRAMQGLVLEAMDSWKGKTRADFFSALDGDRFAGWGYDALRLQRPLTLRERLDAHRGSLMIGLTVVMGLVTLGLGAELVLTLDRSSLFDARSRAEGQALRPPQAQVRASRPGGLPAPSLEGPPVPTSRDRQAHQPPLPAPEGPAAAGNPPAPPAQPSFQDWILAWLRPHK